MTTAMDADSIIATLGMQKHPEGGWYVETWRDKGGGPRGHQSTIYYLLKQGERSHWHRVRDAGEVWHYYAGAPLALHLSTDGEAVRRVVLGPDLMSGARPQVVVEANVWQAAESLGAFTLVGCSVAPGFDFAAFEMAAPDWQPGSPGDQ